MEKLNLTQEWDKVFPKSDKVDHKKVTFHNRYGITLAADLYTPKGAVGKLPGIERQVNTLLLPMVLVWYIFTELGSIAENAAALGAPVPKPLLDALAAGQKIVNKE